MCKKEGKMVHCYTTYKRALTYLEEWVNHKISLCASLCSRNPWRTVAIVVATCCLLSLGMIKREPDGTVAFLPLETDGNVLWNDDSSVSYEAFEREKEYFPVEVRLQSIMMVGRMEGQNVLTKDMMLEMFDVIDIIKNTSIPGTTVSYKTNCKHVPNVGCMFNGVPHFFSGNRAMVEELPNDEAVRLVLNASEYPFGENVERDQVFGDLVVDENNTVVSATAIRWDFYMNDTEVVKEWELELVRVLIYDPLPLVHSTLYLQASRSLDDGLSEVVENDVVKVAVAFSSIIVCAAVTMGRPTRISSRFGLAMLEGIVIGLSIVAGFGISCVVGAIPNSLVLILPFIVIGIGVDDAFVVTGAFDRQEDDDIPSRMQKAYDDVGMSITLTSLTDAFAFFFGALSRLPAVSNFCYFATFTLLVVFILHITLYPAFLTLDARRQEAQRMDCLFCIKVSETTPGRGVYELLAHGMKNKFAPFLTHDVSRIAIIAFFACLFGISVYGITAIDRTFYLIDLAPDDHYFRQYVINENTYFPLLAFSVSIVHTDVDFASEIVQRDIETQASLVENHVFSRTPMSWYQEFRTYAKANSSYADEWNENDYFTGSMFHSAVADFIREPLYQQYVNNIYFDVSGQVQAAKVTFMMSPGVEVENQMKALVDMRDVEQMSVTVPKAAMSSATFNVYNLFYIIFEELVQNFSACLAVVIVLAVIILVSPINATIVFFVLGLVYVDILGGMPMWPVSLNTISIVNLVMAVGLVVDYCAHIAHSFGKQSSLVSRKERVALALGEIGPGVLLGCTSTFVGILPLAFATSEVFRVFFKMFLMIVLVGGAHGLILLPVLLSIFGDVVEPSVGKEVVSSNTNDGANTVHPGDVKASDTGGDPMCLQMEDAAENPVERKSKVPGEV